MVICRGTTSKGKRCRSRTSNAQKFCIHHGGMDTIDSVLAALPISKDLHPLIKRMIVGPIVTPYKKYYTDIKGRIHGIYEEFYENGKPKAILRYVHGKLDGDQYDWDRRDRLHRSFFSNGKRYTPNPGAVLSFFRY